MRAMRQLQADCISMLSIFTENALKCVRGKRVSLVETVIFVRGTLIPKDACTGITRYPGKHVSP